MPLKDQKPAELTNAQACVREFVQSYVHIGMTPVEAIRAVREAVLTDGPTWRHLADADFCNLLIGELAEEQLCGEMFDGSPCRLRWGHWPECRHEAPNPYPNSINSRVVWHGSGRSPESVDFLA